MNESNIDYTRSYVDHVDAYEACWDEHGFWPDKQQTGSKTQKIVFGSILCYNFFITNGLAGLLHCEWGKMVPEFALACGYFSCIHSKLICDVVVAELFPNGLIRSDAKRTLVVEENAEWLESQSNKLDDALYNEGFESKLQSFCEYHCKTLSISPHVSSYPTRTIPYQPSPGEWDRELE